MAEGKADGALADGNIDLAEQAGGLALGNLGRKRGRDVQWLCHHLEDSLRLSPGVLVCFPGGFGVGGLRVAPGGLCTPGSGFGSALPCKEGFHHVGCEIMPKKEKKKKVGFVPQGKLCKIEGVWGLGSSAGLFEPPPKTSPLPIPVPKMLMAVGC